MQQSPTIRSNVITELLRERGKTGRPRWIPVTESPFSREFTYRLIRQGLIGSVSVTLPGSKQGRRLLDSDSLDRFLESLMAEQQATKKSQEAAV
jgi:hypothetical protein